MSCQSPYRVKHCKVYQKLHSFLRHPDCYVKYVQTLNYKSQIPLFLFPRTLNLEKKIVRKPMKHPKKIIYTTPKKQISVLFIVLPAPRQLTA